jgi:hypothetical protein
MTFEPKSVNDTETIAYIAYAVLFIVIAIGIFLEYRKRKSAPQEAKA